MTEDEMAAALAFMSRSGSDRQAFSKGVVFLSEVSARKFSDGHDHDPIHIGNGWLAKNRATERGPIDTMKGDVVVHHVNQLFRVWTATEQDAQEPEVNIAPLAVWSRAEAEAAARSSATETGGRIFWIQTNGEWAVLPN